MFLFINLHHPSFFFFFSACFCSAQALINVQREAEYTADPGNLLTLDPRPVEPSAFKSVPFLLLKSVLNLTSTAFSVPPIFICALWQGQPGGLHPGCHPRERPAALQRDLEAARDPLGRPHPGPGPAAEGRKTKKKNEGRRRRRRRRRK